MDKLIYVLPLMLIIGSILAGIVLIFGQRLGTGLYWILVGLINLIVMYKEVIDENIVMW